MTDPRLQVYSLMIINKSGGLIFQKNFCDMPKMSSNDYLRLAGTFHGLHAICSRGFGAGNGEGTRGIRTLEAKDFRLECFQTLTDTKFVLVGSPTNTILDKVLLQIYASYADFVLKNAFYEMEMPIRCSKFDAALDKLIKDIPVVYKKGA